MPNPVNLTAPVVRFTKILAGLMSLWIRPRRCDLAQRSSDGDCKTQEVPHLEGRNEQPIKGFAAVVFQHQHGSIAVAH